MLQSMKSQRVGHDLVTEQEGQQLCARHTDLSSGDLPVKKNRKTFVPVMCTFC